MKSLPNVVYSTGQFYATHGKKLAVFDFDWTLVKPLEGRMFPKDVQDWQFFNSAVAPKLKQLHADGYSVIVVTNQSKQWKLDQIKNVVATIDIPMLIIVAFEKQHYKPDTKLWTATIETLPFDCDESFFVGDALGRKTDHSDSDLIFAKNAGFNSKNIHSPEEFFTLDSYKIEPPFTKSEKQEMVVMVGYPGSGKSTIAESLVGYTILSGDQLKTPAKIAKELKAALKRGESVIVDATNATREHRAKYVNIAKDLKIEKTICVWMTTDITESMRRNALRQQPVPKVVFYLFRKKFEAPEESEGFEVVKV